MSEKGRGGEGGIREGSRKADAHSIRLGADAKQIVNTARAQLFAGVIDRPLEEGVQLQKMCATTREVLEKLHALALNCRATGSKVSGLDEHARAIEELRQLEEGLKANWPRFDVAELQAALDNPRPPVPVEDVLRELQGPGAA